MTTKKELSNSIVIENVIQAKLRGKVVYQSSVSATEALKMVFVKPFNDPSGKGYQRPVSSKRCKDFVDYLSTGENALFTPILINAGGNWQFTAYDSLRPSFGRLICKKRGSLMDGQHRLGGIKLYLEETNAFINVPFLAFHYLEDEEEISLFDTINTKAKGIGSSLSRYLKRDSEDLSWVAAQLIIQPDSPFHELGTIVGLRTTSKRVTLQNIYNTLVYLTKQNKLSELSKEKLLRVSLIYFDAIKKLFPDDWGNYKESKLTHIVGINALSIIGSEILPKSLNNESMQIDLKILNSFLYKLEKIDWSVQGEMKYLKGVSGSKTLAKELLSLMDVK
ncbi:DGQHR domain-containing protein [Bacillus pumilus]|uniref:DGQHR domain-containing protein n=1 Tax=Bacillus pumilus TaxID=1408 RepID=UPI002417C9A4|nr:DGQHR domain-containing protein [Bacillus pumilus]WFO49274.1 DGQHR domain-containing protein [Bacillus pumilus]